MEPMKLHFKKTKIKFLLVKVEKIVMKKLRTLGCFNLPKQYMLFMGLRKNEN